MVKNGGSAFPRIFLVIALGSPPHMMGWLKPPVNSKTDHVRQSDLTYKIMGKRKAFTFYKKYDTIECNPELIIRGQFICRIVEERQLLSLSKIEVYSHRIQNEEIKKYLRISCISGRTEVGGRPFIVFQNTGAFPRSNSAQVGSIYLKSYAQHQLHKRYSYRWLEVEKKKFVANLCRGNVKVVGCTWQHEKQKER